MGYNIVALLMLVFFVYHEVTDDFRDLKKLHGCIRIVARLFQYGLIIAMVIVFAVTWLG